MEAAMIAPLQTKEVETNRNPHSYDQITYSDSSVLGDQHAGYQGDQAFDGTENIASVADSHNNYDPTTTELADVVPGKTLKVSTLTAAFLTYKRQRVGVGTRYPPQYPSVRGPHKAPNSLPSYVWLTEWKLIVRI